MEIQGNINNLGRVNQIPGDLVNKIKDSNLVRTTIPAGTDLKQWCTNNGISLRALMYANTAGESERNGAITQEGAGANKGTGGIRLVVDNNGNVTAWQATGKEINIPAVGVDGKLIDKQALETKLNPSSPRTSAPEISSAEPARMSAPIAPPQTATFTLPPDLPSDDDMADEKPLDPAIFTDTEEIDIPTWAAKPTSRTPVAVTSTPAESWGDVQDIHGKKIPYPGDDNFIFIAGNDGKQSGFQDFTTGITYRYLGDPDGRLVVRETPGQLSAVTLPEQTAETLPADSLKTVSSDELAARGTRLSAGVETIKNKPEGIISSDTHSVAKSDEPNTQPLSLDRTPFGRPSAVFSDSTTDYVARLTAEADSSLVAARTPDRTVISGDPAPARSTTPTSSTTIADLNAMLATQREIDAALSLPVPNADDLVAPKGIQGPTFTGTPMEYGIAEASNVNIQPRKAGYGAPEVTVRSSDTYTPDPIIASNEVHEDVLPSGPQMKLADWADRAMPSSNYEESTEDFIACITAKPNPVMAAVDSPPIVPAPEPKPLPQAKSIVVTSQGVAPAPKPSADVTEVSFADQDLTIYPQPTSADLSSAQSISSYVPILIDQAVAMSNNDDPIPASYQPHADAVTTAIGSKWDQLGKEFATTTDPKKLDALKAQAQLLIDAEVALSNFHSNPPQFDISRQTVIPTAKGLAAFVASTPVNRAQATLVAEVKKGVGMNLATVKAQLEILTEAGVEIDQETFGAIDAAMVGIKARITVDSTDADIAQAKTVLTAFTSIEDSPAQGYITEIDHINDERMAARLAKVVDEDDSPTPVRIPQVPSTIPSAVSTTLDTSDTELSRITTAWNATDQTSASALESVVTDLVDTIDAEGPATLATDKAGYQAVISGAIIAINGRWSAVTAEIQTTTDPDRLSALTAEADALINSRSSLFNLRNNRVVNVRGLADNINNDTITPLVTAAQLRVLTPLQQAERQLTAELDKRMGLDPQVVTDQVRILLSSGGALSDAMKRSAEGLLTMFSSSASSEDVAAESKENNLAAIRALALITDADADAEIAQIESRISERVAQQAAQIVSLDSPPTELAGELSLPVFTPPVAVTIGDVVFAGPATTTYTKEIKAETQKLNEQVLGDLSRWSASNLSSAFSAFPIGSTKPIVTVYIDENTGQITDIGGSYTTAKGGMGFLAEGELPQLLTSQIQEWNEAEHPGFPVKYPNNFKRGGVVGREMEIRVNVDNNGNTKAVVAEK